MIFTKLKKARELIGRTQQQIAEATGMSQRDISQLESGRKEFIPTRYIQYLNESGIDLNTLFNANSDVVLIQPIIDVSENPALKFAQETINAQRITIDVLMKLVAELERK